MKYDPAKHHRRSIRMKGYDYHNTAAYFVTLCTQDRACLLEDPIVKGIITDVWQALPTWFPTVELDEFVVMPNHVHFVVWIIDMGTSAMGTSARGTSARDAPTGWGNEKDGGKSRPYRIPQPGKTNPRPALGDVVGTFKSLVFKVYLDWIEINDPSRRAKFWQYNYYEHIVRNDRELNAIRQYIIDNPDNWEMDRDNLENSLQLSPPDKVDHYLEDLDQHRS